MHTPIRRFSKPIDLAKILRLASRLSLFTALLLIALLLGQLLSVLPNALAEAQHGLDRFAGQLLIGLLERFAPQLGNFL